MNRQRLANRRPSQTFEFDFEGLPATATVSWFADGSLGEIFLSIGKPGDQIHSMALDMATTASIALQYGVPLATLRAALAQELSGTMRGPLGRALELIDKPSPCL